jgi:hypothetical protein
VANTGALDANDANSGAPPVFVRLTEGLAVILGGLASNLADDDAAQWQPLTVHVDWRDKQC